MTQTIAPPRSRPVPSATVARVALVLVAAVLLITAFATGRITAPAEVTRAVVTVPVADGAAQPVVCPPSRPPVC